MPEISASLVKELRDRTGAGWMECKRALVETKGDLDEAERAILSKLPDLEGKPAEVRAKMIDGRLAKGLFAETVLDDQPWIHDPDRTVGEALAEHGAEVREFVRYALTQ
jgi:elongation factor Ts